MRRVRYVRSRPGAPPRAENGDPIGFLQIKVTDRLFVVSVSVADVNSTVMGGLHDGENDERGIASRAREAERRS
jgi:hypothetical protein